MRLTLFLIAAAFVLTPSCDGGIDRYALVERNNPHVTSVDNLSSLSVGNGRFAFTADVTGLQTFPELYSSGVPLGTQSQWGWHTSSNPDNLEFEETLKSFDFGHGHAEMYTCDRTNPRAAAAFEWYRANPHRINLGTIGFYGLDSEKIDGVDQTLDMWNGVLKSRFCSDGAEYCVRTSCDPKKDMIAVKVSSSARTPVVFRFSYPTGKHTDDASDWTKDELHCTEIVNCSRNNAAIKRTVDGTSYFLKISWNGTSAIERTGRNVLRLVPTADEWSFTAQFCEKYPAEGYEDADTSADASSAYWNAFWQNGGAVDFSHCKDSRAPELERRVVLSQYLLAIQCAGDYPPQETGLTYNSWYGKFHLEMTWWHEAQFALWGREELLARVMPWYGTVEPLARKTASMQGFKGIRWMKMTDPSGGESPSWCGPFLIWQQPSYIYLSELLRRAGKDWKPYYDLVQKSAEFMADFVSYDEAGDRYVLKGCIAAQETLKAAKTVNPPFELSYWHWALEIAQQWRERNGELRVKEWDAIIAGISPLASRNGLYLAAESEPDTYSDIRMYSDHMAVLAAFGVLPESNQFEKETMRNTLKWVMKNWNWDKTWGWDYPTTCMNAVRLMEPEMALEAILMDKRTNTYLANGHNYQNRDLRIYLPGNGGLLTAVALMCAGWDGCAVKNPGFPKNGQWDVRWEGLKPMP